MPQFAFLPAAGGDLRRQGAVKIPCHTAKSAGVLGYCTACFIFFNIWLDSQAYRIHGLPKYIWTTNLGCLKFPVVPSGGFLFFSSQPGSAELRTPGNVRRT